MNLAYLRTEAPSVKPLDYYSETTPVKPIGYNLGNLRHMEPSPTRRALTAFLLCVRCGLPLRDGARLLDVSFSYVAAVSRLAPSQRAQLITGDLKLSHVVNGHGRNGGCPGLTELLKTASPSERLEAARAVGPRIIWDEMCVPLIDEEEAGAAFDSRRAP